MAITLPTLPYNQDALAPYISARTIEFHYGKHHNAYVDNTRRLITTTDMADLDLETIVRRASVDGSVAAVFNDAAQAWNHAFYWQCMKPGGGGEPTGAVAKEIRKTFGSYDDFASKFKATGMSQFGSGWVWLVIKNRDLQIVKTANADTPLAHGMTPLLVADVWEHAYYLDYQNRRADYLSAFIDHLVNWDFVNSQLD